MIHVVATITLQPGTRPAFLGVFRWLTPLVRAEIGVPGGGECIDLGRVLQGQRVKFHPQPARARIRRHRRATFFIDIADENARAVARQK